jgi:arsenate reductase-like glutaredoxin family protein
LNNQELSEHDYKRLILEEYTFLKRPVLVIDDHIVVGNSKAAIEKMLNHLEQFR